jgi:hypothetical protein
VNKVPKRLKIKVTPQTPGIKTNNFYRRWDRIIILFECSTLLLKLLLDDASYQKKGLEKIFSDLLKTSEEQLSTDDFTNIPASTLRIHNVAVWLLFGQVPFLRENYVATTYFRYVICKSL